MPGEDIRAFDDHDLRALLGDGYPVPVERWRIRLEYAVPEDAGQLAVRSAILRELATKEWRTSGEDNPEAWERGWSEVAAEIEKVSVVDPFSLRPGYFRGDEIFRLAGRYVRAVTPDAEFIIGLMVREAVLSRWVRPYERVVEFGCGTGLNLCLLARRFADKHYTGCDWVNPVGRILGRIGDALKVPLDFKLFNMLTASGQGELKIDSRTAICTVHAIEQLHEHWLSFLQMLLRKRPGICVHLEPLLELYSAGDPFDDVASEYHRRRRYLQGFVPALRELERQRQIDIVELRRVHFGGKYHEAYSIAVWRPR